MGKYENIIGKKFGRLTVIDEIHRRENGRPRYYVKCLCDCGNTTITEKARIKNGWVTSCGCAQREMRKTLGQRCRKPDGEACFNEVYGVYKKGAIRRGYAFELSKEEFKEIITQPCIYCGDALTQERIRKSSPGSFKYTGIDRYDNTKGYTKDNSVPCCKVCNRLKTDMPINEFKQRLEKIIARKSIWERTA